MATRFYLPASAASTPISPTPSASWENVTILVRNMTSTSKISDPMATVSFSDASAVNQDILFRQHVSLELTPGQTITGSQALKGQCRVMESLTTGNMLLIFGIRVIGSDGVTVRKELVFNADTVEASATELTNRRWTSTSAADDYVTVSGDRLVIESGMSGDPSAGGSHTSDMRFGDSAATDLPENDTDTTDLNPWVELTDTLTFVTPAPATPSRLQAIGGKCY